MNDLDTIVVLEDKEFGKSRFINPVDGKSLRGKNLPDNCFTIQISKSSEMDRNIKLAHDGFIPVYYDPKNIENNQYCINKKYAAFVINTMANVSKVILEEDDLSPIKQEILNEKLEALYFNSSSHRILLNDFLEEEKLRRNIFSNKVNKKSWLDLIESRRRIVEISVDISNFLKIKSPSF